MTSITADRIHGIEDCGHPITEHDENGCAHALPRADWCETPSDPDVYCPCVKPRRDFYVEAIMVEIRRDQLAGDLPRVVASFSRLHDHTDANMYVLNAMHDDYPAPEHYGDEYHDGTKLTDLDQAIVDAETDMANAVMDEVDRLLAESASNGWCFTCGNPVEGGKCACWCFTAEALQRFMGDDFDGSAYEAARMWDALDLDTKARVWANEYATDHEGVKVYLDTRQYAPEGVRERDALMFPHDEPCPRCGRRQWALGAGTVDPANPTDAEQETCGACGFSIGGAA